METTVDTPSAPPPTAPPPGGAVGRILADLDAWRAVRARDLADETELIDGESAKLHAQIEELQRKLVALDDARAELAARQAATEQESTARAQKTLFVALGEQREALVARAAAWETATDAHHRALDAAWAEAGLQPVYDASRQFKAQRAALDALPSTYRDALLAHHEAEESRLSAWFTAHDGLPSLDAPPVEVDVLFAIDAPASGPAHAIVLLPVPEDCVSRATGDDLRAALALRTVQGIYEIAHTLGQPAARAMVGGISGLLAIEVPLPSDAGQDLAGLVELALASGFERAVELNAAHLRATVRNVPAPWLLTEDDG